MDMTCEKCGKTLPLAEGEFVFYHNRMTFGCRPCADQIKDEIKCAQTFCSAVNSNKVQAEHILSNKRAFARFLNNVKTTVKKLPNEGSLRSDIPLLVALVKSYVTEEYQEIPYDRVVTVLATLLYVVHPIDDIPDLIPGIGFSDDTMVVAFCINQLNDDIEKYKTWHAQRKANL